MLTALSVQAKEAGERLLHGEDRVEVEVCLSPPALVLNYYQHKFLTHMSGPLSQPFSIQKMTCIIFGFSCVAIVGAELCVAVVQDRLDRFAEELLGNRVVAQMKINAILDALRRYGPY